MLSYTPSVLKAFAVISFLAVGVHPQMTINGEQVVLEDLFGNPLSTSSVTAQDKYNQALELIVLHRGNPIQYLDEALAEDPDFGGAWTARAALLVLAPDRALFPEIRKSLDSAIEKRLTEQDKALLASSLAWHEGRFSESISLLARASRDNPRDLLAIQTGHFKCYFLGINHDMRDLPLQALRAFNKGEEGYGILKGMAAFGFEESGEYSKAEEYGLESLNINPLNRWPVHAVTHVHEMRGDYERGIQWAMSRVDNWDGIEMLATHIWWHLALLHLEKGDTTAVLDLLDEKIRPDVNGQLVGNWVDVAAMLWRLHLDGVDTGDRFARLADCWDRAAEDVLCSFNDVHAVMCFLGAGRYSDVDRTLNAMNSVALENSELGYVTRTIGLPLAYSLLDFDAGRFSECIEKIVSVRGVANRFGGSNAQRDVFTLTAMSAALRGGLKSSAEAFASERIQQKPKSPMASRFDSMAKKL